MKNCPTCQRTYPDDSLAFCLMDGSVLSAPYDPEATQRIPPPRKTSPAATEILGTIASPIEPRPPALSTIQAPAPPMPPIYGGPQPGDRVARKSRLPLVLIAVAVLVAGAIGLVMLGAKLQKNDNPVNNPPASSNNTTKAKPSKLACGHTLGTALYDKWIQMGGESGKLGCPIAEEVEAPTSPQGTSGRWAQFPGGDGGFLIQHESGKRAGQVFEVTGCIYKLYASLGGTKSWLGFPIVDGSETVGGALQSFEGGYIDWDSQTYQCQAHKPR